MLLKATGRTEAHKDKVTGRAQAHNVTDRGTTCCLISIVLSQSIQARRSGEMVPSRLFV